MSVIKKVLYTIPGKVAGGGHLGTLEIMDRIRSYGFNPVALIDHMDSDFISILDDRKLNYLYVRGNPGFTRKEIGKFIFHVLKFVKIIKNNNISLIHFNDLESAHYGILSAQLSGIPSVLHVRSIFWIDRFGWLNRLILSQAKQIITNSEFVRNRTIKTGIPQENVVTIHNGIDLEPFSFGGNTSNKIRSELGINENNLVIGFVSRLGLSWKNEDLVYRLLGTLNQDEKRIVLLVVGGAHDGQDKTLMDSKNQAKKLSGNADIRFLGICRNMPEIYSLMDILLVPSVNEPFGRVVVEGMAAGLPVVGSNNGGIPEIITDGYDGFLRAPDDFDGWMAIVKSLIEDKELRKRIGKNARKAVEERFTLDKMIERVAEIYSTLLKVDHLIIKKINA